jgi:uncharacterized surface protein with fasciclin (FAS1) repeats
VSDEQKAEPLLVAILALALAVGAGAVVAQEAEPQAQPSAAASSTVYAVIQGRPELESFRILIDAAGLADNLQQDGPFTVFAPTNEALAELETMTAEMGVTATDVLLYHIVNGRYPAASLSARNAVRPWADRISSLRPPGPLRPRPLPRAPPRRPPPAAR